MCLPVADTSGVSASGVERQSWSESSANRALVGAVQQWSDHATNVIEPAPHGGSRDMAGVDLLEDDGDLEVGEDDVPLRSEEHTSELQSLMRISYVVLCLENTNNLT